MSNGMSLESYIYSLELISLNEDVKYYTLGHKVHDSIGRKNNLSTYIEFINGYLLNDNIKDKIHFIYTMMMGNGIVSMSIKKILSLFMDVEIDNNIYNLIKNDEQMDFF